MREKSTMHASVENPETGERFYVDLDDARYADLKRFMREQMTDKKLERYLDNLPISADAKVALAEFSKVTLRIGEEIFKIGKRIIEIAVYLAAEFPNMTFAIVIGSLLWALVSSLPIIGAALNALASLIIVVLGVKGLIEDIGNRAYRGKLEKAQRAFAPIAGELCPDRS